MSAQESAPRMGRSSRSNTPVISANGVVFTPYTENTPQGFSFRLRQHALSKSTPHPYCLRIGADHFFNGADVDVSVFDGYGKKDCGGIKNRRKNAPLLSMSLSETLNWDTGATDPIMIFDVQCVGIVGKPQLGVVSGNGSTPISLNQLPSRRGRHPHHAVCWAKARFCKPFIASPLPRTTPTATPLVNSQSLPSSLPARTPRTSPLRAPAAALRLRSIPRPRAPATRRFMSTPTTRSTPISRSPSKGF